MIKYTFDFYGKDREQVIQIVKDSRMLEAVRRLYGISFDSTNFIDEMKFAMSIFLNEGK